MENLDKYVTFRKCLTEGLPLLFVDVNRNGEYGVYEKTMSLTQTDKSIMKKLLVEKILDITKNQIYEMLDMPKTNMFDVLNEINISTYIKLKSSTIAVNGRIGNATNILVSEDNFNKYKLQNVCEELELKVLFDDSVKDIILYRKNDVDMPGLILCYTEDKFEIIEIGLFPEKQFYKINLN